MGHAEKVRKKNMKSSFPKRIKRHYKKCLCTANAKFDYYVLEKTFSHMNKYTHTHTYIYIYG